MMLVTIEEAAQHLRIDAVDDLPDVVLKVSAASAAVLTYLGDGATFLDEQGGFDPEDVPFDIKAATLLMLGYLYQQRASDEKGEFEMGYLPRPVTALLYPYRKPSLS